ncbi:MAG: hypothetical protein Q9157_005620, partial [Trypethelium eluteriae]
DRDSPTFLAIGDATMTYMLPPTGRDVLWSSDLVCKDTQQQLQQTAGYPILSVPIGAKIMLAYQENGYITIPSANQDKPDPGTVTIYGTRNSRPNNTLFEVQEWTRDGDGSNKQGHVLAEMQFNNGHCYTFNDTNPEVLHRQAMPQPPHMEKEGLNLWCKNNFTLSRNLSEGLLSVYWINQYYALAGAEAYLLVYYRGKFYQYTSKDTETWPPPKAQVAITYPVPEQITPADFVDPRGESREPGSPPQPTDQVVGFVAIIRAVLRHS